MKPRKQKREGLTPQMINNLAGYLGNSERLKGLSNRELVEECLGTDAADYHAVIEMMNRLWPEWMNKENDLTSKSKKTK